MLQFVAQMSLEDSFRKPRQPRERASQPTLSTPRQPRYQASQPNLSSHHHHHHHHPISPTAPQRHRLASNADVHTPRQPRQRASQPELTRPNAPHRRTTRAAPESETYEDLVQLRGGRKHRHHNRIDEIEEPVRGSTQECAICIEDKSLNDFPAVTRKCKHKATTCSTCVRTWIKGELNAMTWDKLKCIGTGCKYILQHGDMRRLAEREVFERYDKFATMSVLSAMPNFRPCIGPRCDSGQLHTTGADGPIFTCSECRFKHCTIHNVPWHANLTCREYDYAQNPKLKKKEEEASEKAVRELSRKCPGRGCGAPIQRNGGCDHMTCTKCRHEFCWLCYADYNDIRKRGNTAHKSTCRLHSRNLT
jgi:E3 ubiquitin-protein ligase RNF14